MQYVIYPICLATFSVYLCLYIQIYIFSLYISIYTRKCSKMLLICSVNWSYNYLGETLVSLYCEGNRLKECAYYVLKSERNLDQTDSIMFSSTYYQRLLLPLYCETITRLPQYCLFSQNI